MPHGVLFRGSIEGEIRRKIIEADLLDTVIGVGPNLFYGTGIPAAILIMRAPDAKPPERRGRVLFINADQEYEEGRAQNYLRPEHEERIVSAYRAFEDIDGFARVVTLDELAENDFNCNIRRYADNAPPPEPHDVRAHLHGSVPAAEVDTHAPAFATHGVDVTELLVERDAQYWDFADLDAPIAYAIATKAAPHEATLRGEFERLWTEAADRILALADGGTITGLRTDLIDLFQQSLAKIGPLDRYQTAGIVARWWDNHTFDIQTLDTRGINGVIDGWLTTAEASQENKNAAPLTDQPVIAALVPELLEEREQLAASTAELDAAIKAAEATSDEDDEPDDEEIEDDDALSEGELRRLKTRRTHAKRQLKKLDARLLYEATKARRALTDSAAESLVLRILHDSLRGSLDGHLANHRKHLADAYSRWRDKYAITLRDLEAKRDQAATRLDQYLKELGYE